MKQTKAELLQKLAWLDGTAQRLSKDNAALSSRLLSRVLNMYSLENELAKAERECDNFKTLLDEERDEVSRLRGLLADRIEYDRMRPAPPCYVVADHTLASTRAHTDAVRACIKASTEHRGRVRPASR